MTDELKPILFGKTVRVKLADEKEYTLREPSIEALESVEFDINKIDNLKSIKKLAYLMLKEDNKNLSEEAVGKLITVSMIHEKSPFLKALFSMLGIGDEKNA